MSGRRGKEQSLEPAIVWFRQDLRLSDNPALCAAAASGRPLICLYLLDDETAGRWATGAAARWWLHHALTALGGELGAQGGCLVLRRGAARAAIPAIVEETGAGLVTWNRRYEPFALHADRALAGTLARRGVAVETFNAALLYEPGQIATGAGAPFRVFTPFWNALRRRGEPPPPLPPPARLRFHPAASGERLADWRLLPTRPDWAKDFDGTPGEARAREGLADFLERIDGYRQTRDRPDREGTSRLSPHLHWGEIGPRQIWHAVRARPPGDGAETFLKELGWREFCAQLLHHNPDMPTEPLDVRFKAFSWRSDARAWRAWTRGMTGIPIVDAGMRQLWRTGWMHNRVRMITASFLVKHLGIHWRRGEEWFWDTLVDADLASNAANWQWVAGCGADAAPFFRIFNPVLQGQKFDPQGTYVRRFVPELASLPDRVIHRPWEAPAPPADYPAPVVDLAEGRRRALAAFHALKRQA